ncbi:MAG: CdaR family protein [Clostridium sp.]|nr:CdaR family protein [Clostridium sp.]
MEKKNNRQIIIKICSVIAAFCMWLYVSNYENPISSHKKTVPVKLTNTYVLSQSELVLLPNQKFSVPITVRTTDLNMLKLKSSDFKIIADMSTYVLKEGGNKIPVQINSYPDGVNVENSGDMWIDVQLDKEKSKTFPIKIRYSGNPKIGYSYENPIFSETNANVNGASKYVNMVNAVVSTVNVENLSSDTDMTGMLKAIDKTGKTVPYVSVSPSKIKLTVPIEKSKFTNAGGK